MSTIAAAAPTGDRRVGLLAIGQCLKDQYDALATPIPRHLAALVNQLETEKIELRRPRLHSHAAAMRS
jgi:hypothetical protein